MSKLSLETGTGQVPAPLTYRQQRRSMFSALAGPATGLLLMLTILSIVSPHFLTSLNLLNVSRQAATNIIMAAGQSLVIFTGGIDLSVGSVMALAASTAIVAITHHGLNLWLGILLCLLVGAGCGFVNGVIITKGKVPDFIVTLGMLSAARGLALLVTDGMPVPSHYVAVRAYMPRALIALGAGEVLGIPAPFFIALVVIGVTWFISQHTRTGRHLYAVGGNREAARVSGINVEHSKVAAYTASGLLAAVAGLVLAGRLNSANAHMGTGAELNAIASVVMGGTNLFGGEGSLGGTLIGGTTLSVLANGLNLLAVSPFWQQVAMGTVVVSVVVFDQWRRRRLAGRG
ncbi:MAG TPA: ABC transporter permease [Bacillota bacterium]|nr:ABC transporter permease [Bacillota bacterium]